MEKMKTRALAIASVILLLVGCRPFPDQAQVSGSAEALLSDLHARGLFNGAVVLGRDGGIVYEGAWGPANVEAGVPFTPDTPVDGGSLAKNFTAAAVWMLVEDGKLDLEAAVQQYVPEFPHAQTRVRHLIEHSCGVEWEGDLTGLTNQELINKLRERGTSPRFAPGSRYEYSDACYDVAALCVERVSGLRYDTFLRRRVFAPLGMDATFLRPVRLADWQGIRTLSYSRVNGALTLYDVFDNEPFYGGANLYFSARDLHRWITSFYTRPVVGPSALARGLQAAVFANGERSALNRLSWYSLPGRRSFYFTGHWRGFHHEVYWDTDRRLSVVWVTNVLEAKPLPPLLTRALIDILEGRAPDPIADPDFLAPQAGGSLEPMEGTYDLKSVGRVTVEADGDRMLVQVGSGARHEAFPVGVYTVPDFHARIWFSELHDGRYQRLHWLSLLGVTIGERIPSEEE